jgi:hypothetical protein
MRGQVFHSGQSWSASRFPTRGEAVAKRLKGYFFTYSALATRPHHRCADMIVYDQTPRTGKRLGSGFRRFNLADKHQPRDEHASGYDTGDRHRFQ